MDINTDRINSQWPVHFQRDFIWCESLSFTLREAHRQAVFKSNILRKIFGSKWEEVTRDWRRSHNELLQNVIKWLSKSVKIRWVGNAICVGEKRNVYSFLIVNLTDRMEVLDVGGRIILECVVKIDLEGYIYICITYAYMYRWLLWSSSGYLLVGIQGVQYKLHKYVIISSKVFVHWFGWMSYYKSITNSFKTSVYCAHSCGLMGGLRPNTSQNNTVIFCVKAFGYFARGHYCMATNQRFGTTCLPHIQSLDLI
jgi:hypothetical protein